MGTSDQWASRFGPVTPCHDRHRPLQQPVPSRGDTLDRSRHGNRGLDSHTMMLRAVVLQDAHSGPGDVVAAG